METRIWDDDQTVLVAEGWGVGSIVATSPVILQNECDLDLYASSLWEHRFDLDDLSFHCCEVYDTWRKKSGFKLLPPLEVQDRESMRRKFHLISHLLHHTDERLNNFDNVRLVASLLVLHTFHYKVWANCCGLSGRRIATLSNDRMAIVPSSSLLGDFVCRFIDSLDYWVI
jgi:hypothetical protein